MTLEKIYDKCKEKWGLVSQILMLAEEIADVEIMTEEIKYFFNMGELVEHYKAVKLKRLMELLK